MDGEQRLTGVAIWRGRGLMALAAIMMIALSANGRAEEPLRIGVSVGPYAEILEFAGTLAKEQGLETKVVSFTDYTMPNAALAAGDIDLNNFQHKPYLANQIKQRGYDIVALDPSIVVPLAVYSAKLKSLAEIPDGAKVGIPNDPANEARSLLLFEKGGLLKLKPGLGTATTLLDVVDNPKHLDFKSIDAAQLPRALPDVDFAAITLNYALNAGLDPAKQALLREDADTPYGLVFATLGKNKDDPRIRKYIAIYRSAPVRDFVLKRFNGTIIPTW